MKRTFKEYHQYTEDEFKKLWEDCLFVFDTNTLLNMYRYSRETVKEYFNVLKELGKKKQLWIPYQVGYEFYENRIDVIAEYESSYDAILLILEKAKKDIETKYKNHPFLDLWDIKKKMDVGLDEVEKEIRKAKNNHPKWMDKDDVLDNINNLFKNNIGINYDISRLTEIKKEGKERYEKKIPPGYKDDKKAEDKKYGDLILWYQIIDKAKKEKKPIILISGDVKEDWWLEKDGKRIMPLPQLKKEMLDLAGVDFHIYTADRFLEYYNKEKTNIVNKTTIYEVKKIRELEEERRMILRRGEIKELEKETDPRAVEKYLLDYMQQLEIIKEIITEIGIESIIDLYKGELEHLFHIIGKLRIRIGHGGVDRMFLMRFNEYNKELFYVLNKITHSDELSSEYSIILKKYYDKLELLNYQIKKFILNY